MELAPVTNDFGTFSANDLGEVKTAEICITNEKESEKQTVSTISENSAPLEASSSSQEKIVAHVTSTPVITTPALPPPPPLQRQPQHSASTVIENSSEQLPAPPPLAAPTGQQILTRRKRSCLTAAAAAVTPLSVQLEANSKIDEASINSSSSSNGQLDSAIQDTTASIQPLPCQSSPVKSGQPPKKKKKYTPKPKKPAAEDKPKSEPKPKKAAPPKPKAPKSTTEKKSKSKSKKTQQGLSDSSNKTADTFETVPTSIPVASSKICDKVSLESNGSLLEEPLDLALKTNASTSASPEPAIPIQVCIKEEPLEWDESIPDCGDNTSGGELIEEEQQQQQETGTEKPASSSRKKKSKGRNGNIYIGVFNRIEWMKLQEEFGFQTVNNFGTFVLETMSRVHGDIQFWCKVAVASGVYPELSHYEWKNGFPHAVNKDGQVFTPDVTEISEEKKTELGEMARQMWEERLELLKQQQQKEEQQQETAVVEVVAVPDETEEVEEEEGEDNGLENYLGNRASGQYSPMELEIAPGQSSSLQQTLTPAEVNQIWNEQTNNPQAMEIFGKLFHFINSIQVMQGLNVGQTAKEEETKESDKLLEESEGEHKLTLENVVIEEQEKVEVSNQEEEMQLCVASNNNATEKMVEEVGAN